MQELCPLCMKNGVKKRLKLLQINLHEAIWACEAEKCLWPFGYEDFIYSPRPFGKTWSYYWDDQKPAIPKLKATAETSTETLLSSFITAISKNTFNKDLGTTCLDSCQAENILSTTPVKQISNNIEVSPKKEINNLIGNSFTNQIKNLIQVVAEETAVTRAAVQDERGKYANTYDTTIQSYVEESTLAYPISEGINKIVGVKYEDTRDQQFDDDLQLSDCEKKLVDDATRSTNTTTNDATKYETTSTSDNLLGSPSSQINLPPNVQNEKKDIYNQCMENISNVRGIPKITSIAKINIDTASIRTSQTTVCEDLNKSTFNISNSNGRVSNLASMSETKSVNTLKSLRKLQNTRSEENKLYTKKEVKQSDLNITTVQMAGLPIITVSYKLPTFSNASEIIATSMQQVNANKRAASSLNMVETSNNVVKKNTNLVKRHIMSGKQYAKFSFNGLKKKPDLNNTSDVSKNCSDSIVEKPDSKIKSINSYSDSADTKPDVKNKSTNNNFQHLKKSKNFKECESQIVVNSANNSKEAITNESSSISINQTTNLEYSNNDANESNVLKLDTSAVNTSVNIDSMLDDLLTSDYSVSEHINDDWINSLFD